MKRKICRNENVFLLPNLIDHNQANQWKKRQTRRFPNDARRVRQMAQQGLERLERLELTCASSWAGRTRAG